MATEINCKAIAETIEQEAREMAAKFKAQEWLKPKLVTVIASDDPASERYVRNKMRACERCGIAHEEISYNKVEESVFKRVTSDKFTYNYFGNTVLNNEILRLITDCDNNYKINGLMLQLPTYDFLNADKIIKRICPSKDVDCLTARNMGKLALGDNSFMPATVAGIMRLFKEEGYDLQGKTVVVRGRSNIVGKPLALAMINAGATVISENSHSSSIAEDCLEDGGEDLHIVVDATGKERRWNPSCDYYIDVTTIVGEDGKLHGSYVPASENVGKYTPVPRGVGLLTCAQLAWNTVYLACKQVGIEVDYGMD